MNMLDLTLAFGLSDIGAGEILVIGVIALLLFGKNLPTVMKNLGRVYGQVKDTLNAASSEFKKEMDSAAAELEQAKREVALDKDLKNELQDTLNQPLIEPDTPESSSTTTTDSTTVKPRTPPADAIDQSPASLDTVASGPVSSGETAAAKAEAPKVEETPAAEPPKTETPKPAVVDAPANPVSLDQLQNRVAPPKKIPRPI